MTKFILTTIILFLFLRASAQKEISFYFDENGNQLEPQEVRKILKTEELTTVWDRFSKDSGYVRIIKPNKYQIGKITATELKLEIEKVTGKQFNDSTIFLLEYNYLDDLCSKSSSNIWRKGKIYKRKSFQKPIRKTLNKEYKNLVYLNFFEKGIILNNSPKARNEYFYSDKYNSLRELVFKDPTLCGSFAIIKPNGQILVRNGEYRADYMAQHLNPENWNLFFIKE